MVSGLQFSILNIGASLPQLGCCHSDPVQSLSGRTRGDPITNTNMEVRDSEGPRHQRSSLVDRAVNETLLAKFYNARIKPVMLNSI